MTDRAKRNRDMGPKPNAPKASPNPKTLKQHKKTSFADQTDKMETSDGKADSPAPPTRKLQTLLSDTDTSEDEHGAKGTVVTPVPKGTQTKFKMVYDWKVEGKYETSAIFKKTPQAFLDRASAFKADQVYPDEGNADTIHDHARMVKAFINKEKNPRHEPLESEYHEVLMSAQNERDPVSKTKEGKKIVTFGLRLSKTSPETFVDCFDHDTGLLRDRNDTRIWHVANRIFGSNWVWQKKPKVATTNQNRNQAQRKSLQQASLQFKKPDKQDTTTSNEWSVVQTKRGIFRKKTALPQETGPKLALKEAARTHRTFLKLRLPKIKAANSADEEAVQSLLVAINSLMKLDSKLVVYAWTKQFRRKESSQQTKALTKAGAKPESKEGMEAYVDHIFVHPGKWPYMRMVIGHEIDSAVFDDSENPIMADLRNKGIMVYMERIQSAEITTAGWLMGSHPNSFNTKTFHPVLQGHPLLKDSQIDLQIKAIRLDSHHQWSPKDPKAVHVMCAKHQLEKVKAALFTIYGSKSPLASMPMGRSMRFIPYTADPRGMAPLPDMKRNVQTAMLKQTRFVANTTTAELTGVLDLDYSIKVQNQELSIREILQSMKASDFQANMFLAIDEKWNGSVVLTFHTSLADQAQLVTSYLPLLLAERFGTAAWKWFSSDTQVQLSGFYWDEDTQNIKTKDTEIIADNIAGFDDFDEDLDDETESIMEELQENIIKIDLGMQFDLDDPPTDARIVGDEDRSLATFGGGLKHSGKSAQGQASASTAPTSKTNDSAMVDVSRPEDISTITDDQQFPQFSTTPPVIPDSQDTNVTTPTPATPPGKTSGGQDE